MEFSGLTFILTDDCNYRCSYCYQERGRARLDPATAKRAFDLFRPFLGRECSVNFYGGEPLLAAEAMVDIIGHIRSHGTAWKTRITYSLATNGSLLTGDLLDFLERHCFTVLLSFDGYAQDETRRRGSFGPTVAVLRELLSRPRIKLETNSVFTPATVGRLYPSLRLIVGTGAPEATISLANERPWGTASLEELRRQLSALRRFLRARYERTGALPVTNFRKPLGDGVFGCAAGQDRMALSPDGRLWGCYFYYDYARKRGGQDDGRRYCFGTPESFVRDRKRVYPEILRSYADLHMGTFWTDDRRCASCPDVQDCVVCPVDAAFSSGLIGRIMTNDCRIRGIFREQRARMWEDPGRSRPSRPAGRPAPLRGRAEA
jgi:MoaA/NifB/PqqE/SkfB family radical SAM enzyme